MRHFFSPRPITTLASGMAMATGPRILITPSRALQRITPGRLGAGRATITLATITAATHQKHLITARTASTTGER